MAGRKGKCIQFGGCSVADAREVVEVQADEDFICKICGKPLEAIQESVGPPKWPMIAAVAAVLLVSAGGAVWVFRPEVFRSPADSTVPGAPNASTPDSGPGSSAVDPRPPVSGSCALRAVSQPDVNRLLVYVKQGMVFASQNRFDLALKEFEQVQQLDPNFLAMHENIAAAQLKLGELAEAENHLKEELRLIGCLNQLNDTELAAFAYMFEVRQNGASDPNIARAQVMRERLKQAASVAHYNLACIRSRQRNPEQATAELKQAVEGGFSDVAALRQDPDLKNVRVSAGFQAILDTASSQK